MKLFPVLGSWFLIALGGWFLVDSSPAGEEPGTKNPEQVTEVFRPEAGKFPPLEKALSFRGELIFVDHANRRGSLRVQGEGTYFRNAPHPFALLPYGIVRYHGAPADLRDVPLGTVMHVRGFLPPDPKTSVVPVLPVDNRNQTAGYSGKGIAPAENHVLLLEDEPSHCQREGLVWKLREVQVKNREGMILATREPKQGGDAKATVETMTFDAATRVWRGRESHRRTHRGGGVACRGQKSAWRSGGPARDHLETDARWDLHPLSRLRHLARRGFHATRRPKTDRDAQGPHPQPLDARVCGRRRVWQVRPRHRDRHPLRRHGRLALRRLQKGCQRRDERG
jgi:hypothetical protein